MEDSAGAMFAYLKRYVSLLWNYGFEYLVTGIFGFIPTPIGSAVRNLVYISVLDRIGFGVYIQPDVRLIGARNIQLGNRVRLYKDVYLSNRGNPIVLKGRVQVLQGAAIRSQGGFGGGIEIGEKTLICRYVCIGGPGPIKVGRDCMIANNSSIHANNHNFGDISRPITQQGLTCKGITIEDNCWLGAGVRVLDGVTIGKGSVIGAGAVVTRSIPPYSVAVGVPAKVVRQYHKPFAQEKVLSAQEQALPIT
jgi:acetyltransferase-like isoleucine patch superfamily enzyme